MRFKSFVVVATVGLAAFVMANSISPLSRDKEGIPTDPISKGYVSGEPEALLVYPGAELVSRDAYAEQPTSNSAAGVRSKIRTGTVPTVVLDWYSSTLERGGWHLTDSYDHHNEKLAAGLQRARMFQRGAREHMDLYLCDGCPDLKSADYVTVGAGEINIHYWILPASCVGQYSCGQGTYIGGT